MIVGADAFKLAGAKVTAKFKAPEACVLRALASTRMGVLLPKTKAMPLSEIDGSPVIAKLPVHTTRQAPG